MVKFTIYFESKYIDVISRKTYCKIINLEELPNVVKVGLIGGITVIFVIGAVAIINLVLLVC